MENPFDVVIVGASVAGCTAATLLGRLGLKVALLERASDPGAYKKVCTHYLQPSAVPTLRRLGLEERIVAAGGVPNEVDFMTPTGWIPWALPGCHGYNLRREKLDPMMR